MHASYQDKERKKYVSVKKKINSLKRKLECTVCKVHTL